MEPAVHDFCTDEFIAFPTLSDANDIAPRRPQVDGGFTESNGLIPSQVRAVAGAHTNHCSSNMNDAIANHRQTLRLARSSHASVYQRLS